MRSSNPSTFTCTAAATSGGAGYCAGDVNPTSGSLTILNSVFASNDAQLGGSIYATTGCIADIRGTTFTRNTARQYGSAFVTTSYVTLSIQNSTFFANGNATSGSIQPPTGGGAISIGYDQFVVGESDYTTITDTQKPIQFLWHMIRSKLWNHI